MRLWAKKFSQDNEDNGENTANTNETNNVESSTVKIYIKSDEFSRHFVEWFYSCLNSIHSSGSSLMNDRFNSSAFCSNATVDLYLLNVNCVEYHGSGAEDCEKLFRDIISRFKFSFTPNLENGTQALKSLHGLIKVLSCGTLHTENNFMGIFEQEFCLVQSPIDKNWKIFATKVNLKTSSNASAPALPASSVFEIESL